MAFENILSYDSLALGKVFSVDFQILPQEQALVSTMDRGFLYGDSVYEVVRTYRGSVPFLLDRHYRRMGHSAEAIALKIPFSLEKLRFHVEKCVAEAKNPDSYVRMIVSRGCDDRFDLFPQPALKPKTVIMVDAIQTYPKSYFEEGIAVALVSIRRNLRTAVDPNIKSGNYLNNMLAIMEARGQGAVDAIMLNYKNCVTEATTSNVFMVRSGVVMTPDVESGILEGISRSFVIDILTREKMEFQEREISREFFVGAEEIFITGTTKEIMPVTRIDGKGVGTGRPGPVTKKLMALFAKEVERSLGRPV